MKPFRCTNLGDVDMKIHYEDLEFTRLPGMYKGFPVYLESQGAMLLYVEDGDWLLKDADAQFLHCSLNDGTICVEFVEEEEHRWHSLPFRTPEQVVFTFNHTPLAQVLTAAKGRISFGTIKWQTDDPDGNVELGVPTIVCGDALPTFPVG